MPVSDSTPLSTRIQLESVLSWKENVRIFEGRHPATGEAVAVKVLALEETPEAETLKQRFLSTAGVLGTLTHPNLPKVLDSGISSDGDAYLVFEWLEGTTLARIPGLVPRQILNFLIQATEGLESLALHGLVHLNLEPDNLLITTQGQVKILGLGPALLSVDGGWSAGVEDQVSEGYLAPEVLRLRESGPRPRRRAGDALWRADLYALALLVARQLGAEVEGEGTSRPKVRLPAETLEQLNEGTVLETMLERCLHEDPYERPVSYSKLARALQHALPRLPREQALLLDTQVIDLQALSGELKVEEVKRKAELARQGAALARQEAALPELNAIRSELEEALEGSELKGPKDLGTEAEIYEGFLQLSDDRSGVGDSLVPEPGTEAPLPPDGRWDAGPDVDEAGVDESWASPLPEDDLDGSESHWGGGASPSPDPPSDPPPAPPSAAPREELPSPSLEVAPGVPPELPEGALELPPLSDPGTQLVAAAVSPEAPSVSSSDAAPGGPPDLPGAVTADPPDTPEDELLPALPPEVTTTGFLETVPATSEVAEVSAEGASLPSSIEAVSGHELPELAPSPALSALDPQPSPSRAPELEPVDSLGSSAAAFADPLPRNEAVEPSPSPSLPESPSSPSPRELPATREGEPERTDGPSRRRPPSGAGPSAAEAPPASSVRSHLPPISLDELPAEPSQSAFSQPVAGPPRPRPRRRARWLVLWAGAAGLLSLTAVAAVRVWPGGGLDVVRQAEAERSEVPSPTAPAVTSVAPSEAAAPPQDWPPELERLLTLLAADKLAEARRQLAAVAELDREGGLPAIYCEAYRAVADGLDVIASEAVVADLRRALRRGDVELLRSSLARLSPAETARVAATAEGRSLIAEARRARAAVDGFQAAVKAGEYRRLLEGAFGIEKSFPALSRSLRSRERAAALVESEADALIGAGQFEGALERLELLQELWPDRPALAGRLAAARDRRKTVPPKRDLQGVLDRVAAAERRQRPHEGLQLLNDTEPGPRFVQAFAEARNRLTVQLEQLDAKPPLLRLRPGVDVVYRRGAPVVFELQVSDDYRVGEVWLYARSGGRGKVQTFAAKKAEDDFYRAEVPPDFHRDKTISFWVSASDLSGHQSRLGSEQTPLQLKRGHGRRR